MRPRDFAACLGGERKKKKRKRKKEKKEKKKNQSRRFFQRTAANLRIGSRGILTAAVIKRLRHRAFTACSRHEAAFIVIISR
jgi:hypothetical protein